ncbi:hypothetical protein GQ457_17G004450 [Hibiscus cannabinus]
MCLARLINSGFPIARILSHDSNTGGSKMDHYDGNQLQSQGARGRRGGYHTAVSSGNNQKVDTPVQVFTHTLSPMSASPQQMMHSGFNVSVPTQGVLMSHPVSGSMHQMTPMHISQGGSSHASSHAASSPTTPTTYVTTSSQWPVISDGAWYPDTGATHHVTNDSANLQAGTVYTGNRRLLMGNGDGVLISQIGQGSLYTNGRSLVLQNLLHVPLIKKNLLSVSQLVRDNDVVFEFNANGCVIKSSQNQNVLLRGKLTPEGLYQLASPIHNNGASSSSLHSGHGDLSFEQLNPKNVSLSTIPMVSSQQQCVHVSQQPRVTVLGGGSSGCHSNSHIQDETRHSNDVQEGLQESGFSESQQQSLEESQQQAQVDVQDSDIGIQNDDVGEDSVQVSLVFSGNDIYEDMVVQDARVADEIIAGGSQGDNAVLDEFQDDLQTGNEMQSVDIMEPDGDDGDQ